MIDPSQFITRNALDSLSIRFVNELKEFTADDIFTPVYVDKSLFKVYQYDTSHLRQSTTVKSSKAEADKVDYGVFTRDRETLLHKLGGEIDPRDERDFDSAVSDIRTDIAQTIWQRLMLDKEVEAATIVEDTSLYPAALTATLATNFTWLDASGSPETNVSTAKAAVHLACGRVPNAAQMSWTTFELLRASPYFLEKLKYTSAKAINEEDIRAWLRVDYLHIGAAVRNTSVEGNATQTLADVWGDGILFYVKDPAPRKRSMRYGANYIRNQLYTYEYEDAKRGSGDGRIKVLEQGWEYVLQAGAVVSSSDNDFTAGYYLDNVV